jgi:two-component system sensor histidine kinase GlrK
MSLTIFQRLTAGYLVIMLMILGFGGYTVFQLNRLSRITHRAAGADSDAITLTGSLATRLQVMPALEKKYWISGDPDFLNLFIKRNREFQDVLNTLLPLLSDIEAISHLQAVIDLNRDYLETVQILSEEARSGLSDDEQQIRDQRIDTMSARLDLIRLSVDQARHDTIILSQTISTRVFWVTMGLAAVCIAVGLFVSLVTTRSIVHPVLELQHRTRDIAAGQFIPIRSPKAPPEIRHLADDFNVMSEKLNELDMLKEDFISHLSHTLRTPLTSIWEASGMLRGGTFDQDPDSRRRLLSIVRDECARLITSVNRLLDLSRMEAGMMDYQFERINLNDLIETTVDKLSPIARSRSITLHTDLNLDLPAIPGDPETLTQLLDNLIGNALKFTDPGGTVTVSSGRIDRPADSICVSVNDTGCGIEPEYLEHIFEKFRRIEKRKNTVRGTGLGLSIAKHIVAAHGGNLWVESEKNTGSTFYVSLPLS